MAERRTFSTCGAIRLLVARRMLIASPQRRPRIKSPTSRAFCGEVRTHFIYAIACISSPRGLGRRSRLGGRGRCGFCRVAFEYPGRRKLPELVAHHVFGNEHGNEFL